MLYFADNQHVINSLSFCQDFKDTFVCNTQRLHRLLQHPRRRFIRISKILLYAIHNMVQPLLVIIDVVLSGFQRYFCMQYTTSSSRSFHVARLFYQDFKDTFVCNTQPIAASLDVPDRCFIRISKDTFFMQYTTTFNSLATRPMLFYQDFKDTFVCNTQHMGMNK